MDVEDRLGLRERKKLATREALSAAALRLALEQGPANVRVDDIAEAAGVSPRTYNNYFSSREQAIMVALAAERSLRVAAAMRARPSGEPLHVAVIEAVVGTYAGDGEPDRETLRLVTSAPAMRAEFLDTVAAIEYPLAQAIAARVGEQEPGALRPAVLAAAVSAAARVAAAAWLSPDQEAGFGELLRRALDVLVPALAAVPR